MEVSDARRPRVIVSDNGTEFTSNAILAWQQRHDVEWHYIASVARRSFKTAMAFLLPSHSFASAGGFGILLAGSARCYG
jgi:hypothetical protein